VAEKKITVILLTLMALIVGGCNLPSSSPITEGTQIAVYTQAAETIVAQLTGIASPGVVGTPTVSFPLQTAPPTVTPLPTQATTATASPTPTTAASSTPAVTETPAVTQTPAPSDPKASLGDPAWRDDFSKKTNWSLYEDDYVSFEIEDGKLVMQARSSESRDSWLVTVPKPVDYYLEAVVAPYDCSGLDRYGVILRTDAQEGYLFGFSCDGQFSLRKWDGEQFTAIIDWTSNPFIRAGAGQTNRLGVWVEGDTFRLYANGYVLGVANDDSYDTGKFGVFFGTSGNEAYYAEMDEIAYWDLP
jgi:hypothetical protein